MEWGGCRSKPYAMPRRDIASGASPHTIRLPVTSSLLAPGTPGEKIESVKNPRGAAMNVNALFARLEIEFEMDIPEEIEESLVCVRDVRDFIRTTYRAQGIEAPAGAIFERVRRLAARLADADASDIRPETKFSEIVARRTACG